MLYSYIIVCVQINYRDTLYFTDFALVLQGVVKSLYVDGNILKLSGALYKKHNKFS